MENIEIYCDLDGVLADFENAIDLQKYRKPNGKVDWDKTDYNFFCNLPVFPGAYRFYSDLKTIGKVYFLTGLAPNIGCSSGKMYWIANVFGEANIWRTRKLILCASETKCKLAKSNRVLIDDRVDNLQQWEDAGGIAISCVRSNGMHEYDKVLQKLQQKINSPVTTNNFTEIANATNIPIKILSADFCNCKAQFIFPNDAIPHIKHMVETSDKLTKQDAMIQNIKISNMRIQFPMARLNDAETAGIIVFDALNPIDNKDTELYLNTQYVMRLL